MKIALNASLLYDAHLRGWNRYTVSLIEELKKQDIALCLYSRRAIHPSFKDLFGSEGVTYREAPLTNYFYWEQVTLNKWCKEDRVDILHSPFNYGLPFNSPCPTVLTLHDAIEEKFYGSRFTLRQKLSLSGLKSHFLQSTAPKNADHILTVSYHAKEDIKEVFKVPEEKISVTYEAHPEIFSQRLGDEERSSTLSRYKIDSPFFFYIGGFDERKNIEFLLEAFAKASLENHKLVLAGGGNKENLQRKASALGINSQVHFTGYVEDADLPAFYQGADGFVYPSFYEGFGLQVCEAMASGCPTLVSDRASLPEILGAGGLVFDLDDVSHLSEMLSKISLKPDLKTELSEQALKRSNDFSWRNTATQTIQAYKKLLGKN